ncbi:MAG: aminomethyl transferase family protein, partial [Armatimonadetes bacterium]|nr:aminomethyl transferase family protein [Armatimonadota bacterium]
YLDRFLVMERCEIEELTDTWAHISVQGPQSGYLLGAVLGADVPSQAEWEVRCYPLTDAEVVVARVFRCGEDGFDLFLPAPLAAPLCAELSQPRPAFALHSIGWEALNVRRVEAGIPWWGFELSPAIVPLEARLDHAVCRSKGCYVGQEIIARIDARGHVNNLLGGVLVESDQLPPHNAEIYAGGKRVGRTCSAVRSVRLGRNIALAYFRRELHRPGEILEALTPSGPLPLVVASLPFVPDDSPQFAPPASGG